MSDRTRPTDLAPRRRCRPDSATTTTTAMATTTVSMMTTKATKATRRSVHTRASVQAPTTTRVPPRKPEGESERKRDRATDVDARID